MPLSSFIRYVSKHLPTDIRSTIRTREFTDIAELEKILQAYQSMKEEEDNKYQSINIRDRESRSMNTDIRQPDHLFRNDNNMSGSEEGAWLCPHPVSYTHLDVYKRQDLISYLKFRGFV